MSKREIIDSRELNIALNRLCCKLIENHGDFSNSILIGLQPRGAQVLQRIVQLLENEYKVEGVRTGLLDITFYRDDFRRREGHLQPNKTKIDFLVEDQNVVFIGSACTSTGTPSEGWCGRQTSPRTSSTTPPTSTSGPTSDSAHETTSFPAKSGAPDG